MIWGQVRSESWLRRPNRRNFLSDCSCQSSAVLEGESLQETNKNSKATSCRLIGQTTATSGGWRWCENLCQRWHHEGSLHQWGGHQPHVIIDKSLIQGWGNIWDSAEHWPWMEGPTIAGKPPQNSPQYYLKQSQLWLQIQFTVLQPSPTDRLKHAAGGGEESDLDSLPHLCQHCHSGFLWDFLLLSIRFAYNFM